MSGEVQLGAYIHGDETVRQAVETESQGIVVTDQRVLAFVPAERDVTEAALDSVTGVTTGTTTPRRLLPLSLACAILGLPFTVAGLLLDVDALGGLDTVLLVVGGGLLVGALALGVGDRLWREPAVVIGVADAPDIRVPWPSDAATAGHDAAATDVANAVIAEREDDQLTGG